MDIKESNSGKYYNYGNDWSQQSEKMQGSNGTGPGIRIVSVSCRHAIPVANILQKPLNFS